MFKMKNPKVRPFTVIVVILGAILISTFTYNIMVEVYQEHYDTGYDNGQVNSGAWKKGFRQGADIQGEIYDFKIRLQDLIDDDGEISEEEKKAIMEELKKFNARLENPDEEIEDDNRPKSVPGMSQLPGIVGA